MTAKRPTFRVMKNGYDRFAVDDAVEQYAEQVETLEKKNLLYQQQLSQREAELDALKQKYTELENSIDGRREAAEEIARLSLREANDIIASAESNADAIVREALSTARLILVDLSKLYKDADVVKDGMSDQLQKMLEELDQFRIPEMPDMRWLQEAERKLKEE